VPILPRDAALSDWAREKDGVFRVSVELQPLVNSWAERLPAVKLSRTVQAVLSDRSRRRTTASIVSEILARHAEYAGGTAGRVHLDDTGTRTGTGYELVSDVRALFREDVVPELNGRWMIRGLALLDPKLTKQLLDYGFLTSLEDELKPKLLPALTPGGRQLWEPGDVPTHSDRPADRDRLQREQFASGLAAMIDEQRRHSEKETGKPESFLVQLHGPWGSGKSTLLVFVKEKLEAMDARWIVVDFNAWQQERLGAPWWSLMTAVHRAAQRPLRAPSTAPSAVPQAWWEAQNWWRFLRLLCLELFWRFRLGWMAYLLLPAVVGLLWYGAENGWFETAKDADVWTRAGELATAIGAILALVVAVVGAVRGLTRALAAGSARGADTFLKTSQDPMRTLQRRYERIVDTAGRPIAVFVDDLDRCQPDYVVEVLQGIQTLLIDAPVTYVVAADRRWLYDSYAKVYEDFASVGQDPGRPLGHLFLEKTFQLTAALPGIPGDVRDGYWRELVVPGSTRANAPASDELVREAEQRVEGVGLDEALGAVQQSEIRSAPEQRAMRAAVSSRLTDSQSDLNQEIEHRLIPFGDLVESSPRSMKRLINAYKIELHRLLAEDRRVGTAGVTPEQLALWTILSMRWPLLADQLAQRPELVSDGSSMDWTEQLRDLWDSEDVKAVVTGYGVPARLTESAVRALVGLKPRPEPPGSASPNGGAQPEAVKAPGAT
jgi:KAP family P-loop domain